MKEAKLYKKYVVTKTSGEPINPEAQYFILRIDTDVHARIALRAYIKSIRAENMELARDLINWLGESHDTEAGNKEIEIISEKFGKASPKGGFFNP